MKHSNLYLGLVLPSGGWQSLIVRKMVSIHELDYYATPLAQRVKSFIALANCPIEEIRALQRCPTFSGQMWNNWSFYLIKWKM
jgi:hypothetical protein